MSNVFIVDATRGLGAELAKYYTSTGHNSLNLRTSNPPPSTKNITYILSTDISSEDASSTLARYPSTHSTTLSRPPQQPQATSQPKRSPPPSSAAEVAMYKARAIGPPRSSSPPSSPKLPSPLFTPARLESRAPELRERHHRVTARERGRWELCAPCQQGGAEYVREAAEFGFEGAWEFAIRIVHPGFMHTEMTREGLISVGIRGAMASVTPDVAAKPLAEWVETFGMDKTGQYWAPGGAADIGTAEPWAEG